MNRLLRIKHTFLTHNRIMEINELPTCKSFGVNNTVKHITKCRKYEDTGKKTFHNRSDKSPVLLSGPDFHSNINKINFLKIKLQNSIRFRKKICKL
ncbi:RNase H domain-containing protein [Aphis craccivora]|uniref:RNase H domain-containing protein n=1 Tax=Aphis craccivora TaxID=307492 RepID=A0A6G0ZHA2_APHCR|nr:RNase H domain-containing protein [Aphis craccivora]